VPNVAGEDYSRLQLTVEEARLAKQQTEREITRVEPLVQQELLPERRLIELRNELETHSARLSAAQGRLGRVLTPGGAGGLSIRSTLDGVVSHVLVPNGEPVDAGAPLARIGGTTNLWLRMRFVARSASSFPGARPAAVRLPSGERLDLAEMGARLLSALPVVEPSSRLATWVIEVAPSGGQGAGAGTNQPALQAGTPVVALLRIGEPRNVLAVPRQAVIEIDTRPFVFVQVDGEHFEKRAVTLGNVDGTYIEIVSGVSKGERIVTSGGFDVHLASLMGSVESHRH
jgi:membrane fusion protein, heavy metal efflux system